MSSDISIEQTSRDRVLQAAQQLIIEHGYVDFSMRELAEMSGLAKATLYHHFPDKEAICRSVIDIELAALSKRLIIAAKSSDDPIERITSIINELFGPEAERRIAVLVSAREIPGMGLNIKEIVDKYRHELVRPIAEVIQDGIDKGVFRHVNVDLTVLSLMGMMQSFVTHRLIVEPEQQFSNILDHTIQIFLVGISNRQ